MAAEPQANPVVTALELIADRGVLDANLVYETWSDMLYIDLAPHTGPSVSLPLFKGWMVRVDRVTREPFGLHIENAMDEIDEFPLVLDLIALAEAVDAEPNDLKATRLAARRNEAIDALNEVLSEIPRRLVAAY